MNKKLTILLIISCVVLFTGCSNTSRTTVYTYKIFPKSSDYEYSKYLIIEGVPVSSNTNETFRDEYKIFENIYKIRVKKSSYENVEYDSTGKKVNVLRETDTFEFLDTIKVRYRGKDYRIRENDIDKLHKMVSMRFRPTEKIDDKDSYYILDIGRVELEIYNFHTDKITKKIIKIPPLKFKMWLDTYEYHDGMFEKGKFPPQLMKTSSINYKEKPIYSGWVENYKGDLPLINQKSKNKK